MALLTNSWRIRSPWIAVVVFEHQCNQQVRCRIRSPQICTSQTSWWICLAFECSLLLLHAYSVLSVIPVIGGDASKAEWKKYVLERIERLWIQWLQVRWNNNGLERLGRAELKSTLWAVMDEHTVRRFLICDSLSDCWNYVRKRTEIEVSTRKLHKFSVVQTVSHGRTDVWIGSVIGPPALGSSTPPRSTL